MEMRLEAELVLFLLDCAFLGGGIAVTASKAATAGGRASARWLWSYCRDLRVAWVPRVRPECIEEKSSELRGEGISTGFDAGRMFIDVGDIMGDDGNDDESVCWGAEYRVPTASGDDHAGSLNSLALFGRESFKDRGLASGDDGGEDEYLKERGTSILQKSQAKHE